MRGARELMGGKVASLGRVWNRFSLHKNRPNVLLKIFAYAKTQHVLVWTNSALWPVL